ncbi:sugar phosphate isomerase/epimerase family protein [Leifsonia sp. LS-T14]|uniref:sugar phosphate isomerase/epimerase family protein n=1 Tax=unclassified Leifsonia TaxID=2663824 RepID=UPI0035A61D89
MDQVISVQLWSVREEIDELGWDAVIDALADAGFEHVEPFHVSRTLPKLAAALARTGITTPTVHGELVGDELPRTIDAAAEAGATLVMHPSFPADRWHAPDGVERIADDLARAAELAAPLGMRVAFHNHDDDLRVAVDGRPALVALMERVGPSAGVEFDPYWATIAGVDVPATMTALGDKILAMHLKDGPLTGANEDQVAVGDGELDWPGFLSLAPAGVPLVIGLDEFRGPTLDAVIRSRERLVRMLEESA